jgi:hypothetical protein
LSFVFVRYFSDTSCQQKVQSKAYIENYCFEEQSLLKSLRYTFPVKDTYDNNKCNGIPSEHLTMKTVTCSNWNTLNEGNNVDDEYGTIGSNVIISKITTDSGENRSFCFFAVLMVIFYP